MILRKTYQINANRSIFTFKRNSWLLNFFVFHCQSNWYRNWVYGRFNHLRPYYVTRFIWIRLYYFVYGRWLYRLPTVIYAILTFPFPITSTPSVSSFSHLVLGYLCPFFSSPLTPWSVLFKILVHDVLVANGAWFCSGSTSLNMFFKLTKRPAVLTEVAVFRSSRAEFKMLGHVSGFYHLFTQLALDFEMKLLLYEMELTSCCSWSLTSTILEHLVHFLMFLQQYASWRSILSRGNGCSQFVHIWVSASIAVKYFKSFKYKVINSLPV